MKRVWKYEVPVNDETITHNVPVDGRVVHVGAQAVDIMCVWIEVNDAAAVLGGHPDEPRHFRVFGTGHEVPDLWTHVGSDQAGPFVWHVYERTMSVTPASENEA